MQNAVTKPNATAKSMVKVDAWLKPPQINSVIPEAKHVIKENKNNAAVLLSVLLVNRQVQFRWCDCRFVAKVVKKYTNANRKRTKYYA